MLSWEQIEARAVAFQKQWKECKGGERQEGQTLKKALLECCEFNWSQISPAIFGAMFQRVMDETERRSLDAYQLKKYRSA